MRRLFRVSLIAAALAFAGVTAGVARADVPATMQGEEFHQFVPQLFVVSGTCDPTGTSTLSFTVTNGFAVGPYPGVVNASGFVSFGPQTSVPETQSGFPFTKVGAVTQFQEYFTVDSAVTGTTVTGTKSLTEIAGNPFSEGACATAPDGTTTWYFLANAAYDADIKTPTGEFRDSGLTYAEIQPLYSSETGLIIGAGFSEFFLASNGVVPFTTTGHATGGGQIDHVDGSPGATFGFNAYSKDDGTILGQCNVVDGAVHVRCQDATQYSQVGSHATFSGTADVDGTPATYRIDVQDNAEPGAGADTFSITTSTGFSASGILTEGNIQVHS